LGDWWSESQLGQLFLFTLINNRLHDNVCHCRELGEQLTQKKAKEGELEESGVKAQEIEHDMAMYRSQVDDLKKEISNIERGFRNQIATNEKKAHENWVSSFL
jgi:hypothetical protein